jgi:hypothetical protein
MTAYEAAHPTAEVKIYARVKEAGYAPKSIEIGLATIATQDQYTATCIFLYGDTLVGVYALDEHVYASTAGAVKRIYKGPAC